VKGRPQADRLERVGVLVASGLIVGESLFGVLNSGLIRGQQQGGAARPGAADFAAGPALGVLAFVA
jgi:uncharacterized oligopeptide transporter (OPT) family protein